MKLFYQIFFPKQLASSRKLLIKLFSKKTDLLVKLSCVKKFIESPRLCTQRSDRDLTTHRSIEAQPHSHPHAARLLAPTMGAERLPQHRRSPHSSYYYCRRCAVLDGARLLGGNIVVQLRRFPDPPPRRVGVPLSAAI